MLDSKLVRAQLHEVAERLASRGFQLPEKGLARRTLSFPAQIRNPQRKRSAHLITGMIH